MYNIFYVITGAFLKGKEHLFRYRTYFEENRPRFVRARAHVRTLITRVSCAVGMRNAKLIKRARSRYFR